MLRSVVILEEQRRRRFIFSRLWSSVLSLARKRTFLLGKSRGSSAPELVLPSLLPSLWTERPPWVPCFPNAGPGWCQVLGSWTQEDNGATGRAKKEAEPESGHARRFCCVHGRLTRLCFHSMATAWRKFHAVQTQGLPSSQKKVP